MKPLTKNLFLVFSIVLLTVGLSSFTGYIEYVEQAEITNPEFDGHNVGRSMRVEGTAKLPNHLNLWIFSHRSDYEDVWYPQGEVTPDMTTRNWKRLVHFGNSDDIGEEFEIIAIVVDKVAHAQLKAYWKQAMKTGNWYPIPLPKAKSVSKIRSVHKSSH